MKDSATAFYLSTGRQGSRISSTPAGHEKDSTGTWTSQPDWTRVWIHCCRIIHRWRVPPRWSRPDWHEELRAEAFAAAVEAMAVFDPSYNVTLFDFVRGRILSRAIARYRKEWSYSQRLANQAAEGEVNADEIRMEELTALRLDLRQRLARLPELDRKIMEGLFWHGKTESQLAREMGVSQQWVSRRKRITIEKLRRQLNLLSL